MADSEQTLNNEDRDTTIQFYGGPIMSLFPILFFVLWAILQSAVMRISDPSGLVIGVLLGLIIGMFFIKGSWDTYANTIFEGMTQKVAATAIVAWLWAGMFAETLEVGGFVKGLVWLAGTVGVGKVVFPAVTFLFSALFATGIGTGYGTTIAFATLFFPAGVLLGANPVLMFGAILSGAVFGDNLAPVSDTTIVSAVTQDADIGGVVASRFKYAFIAAFLAFGGYIVASTWMEGIAISGEARTIFLNNSNPFGLVHIVSMGVVIVLAVRGRHIIEAISWGIIVAFLSNLILGLSSFSDMLVFKVSKQLGWSNYFAGWPFVELVKPKNVGPDGSLYAGATGFFPMIVLVLLIVAAGQIMIRGGGFQALQEWILRTVATTVRGAEMSMVAGTALVNGMITINTAAEIAIAPYIANIGKQYNINGYRRANILDANTAALGYIFPWSGGVLIGYSTLVDVMPGYEWYTRELIVSPVEVWPYVFHGWILLIVFLVSAWTGFGREYTCDRVPEEVARV
ncbi:MAG: Na+/H+ antiporter NhaC family protein [bacterium]